MQGGEDPARGAGLDGDALGVHRDVQPRRSSRRASNSASASDGHGRRDRGEEEHAGVSRGADRRDSARAAPRHERPGHHHGQDQAGGRGQEREAQRALVEPQPLLHLGEPRVERGEQEAVAREHGGDGDSPFLCESIHNTSS